MTAKAWSPLLLLVEDDPGIRRSLLGWAALCDLRVVTYTSVEECMQALREREFVLGEPSHEMQVSHAIVDFTLPGATGLELVSAISPPLALDQITLITARTHEMPSGGRPLEQMPNVLRKPFQLSELESLLGL